MNRIIKISLLIFMALLLFLFIRGVNFSEILHSLYQVGWGGFILLIGVTAIAYWMATLAWKSCFSDTRIPVSTTKLFVVRHIGEVVALINPTSIAGGEAVKMILLHRYYDIPKQTTASSILIARLILIYTQLFCFFGITGLLLLTGTQFPRFVQQMIWGLVLVLVFTLIILSQMIHRHRSKHIQPMSGHRLSPWKEYKLKLRKVWETSMHFFTTNPRDISYSSLYAILHWVFGGLEFYIILCLFRYDVTIASALFVDLGVVFFKTAGAYIPGQIGVEEIGNKMMLESIGIADEEVWITASLLRRGRQLCWVLLGIVFYLMMRKKMVNNKILPDGSIVPES